MLGLFLFLFRNNPFAWWAVLIQTIWMRQNCTDFLDVASSGRLAPISRCDERQGVDIAPSFFIIDIQMGVIATVSPDA
jgi:hypothetical protein